jgi:hypothetical protein
MFIQQLFEDSAKRIIVTYPGRFQPFHKGHAEVFANLQRQFGSENVFIVTSNKTDAVKSPFNFSDKVRFMHAMGIPNHQIIETDKVYDLPGRFEPVRDQIVFITVVGAPDARRLNPGATKKDGSQSYFQNVPQSKTEFETADKHGYVIVEPEHPETIVIGGKKYDVSHGTPTRELWNTIRNNPQQRGEFVTQLYGRADSDLANILDKIPTGAPEPAPKPSPKLKAVKQPEQDATKELTEFAPPGGKIKTDPTYNVDEVIQTPVPKGKDAEQYYKFIVGKARMGRPLTRTEQDYVKMYQVYRQQKLAEFAPPGGDDGNDGFSDETLKRLAAQWYNGDEDPRVEQTLAASGWEIGQDEGYDDTPGVFVVQAGDINGDSYISWPAEELEGLGEGAIITKDQLVDIYIKGKGKNNMPIQKKVGAQIPNSKVNAFITAVADKYGLNPKAFVYGPSDTMSEDAAGVGVIASKKQKNDPRYSMSLTKDVGPGEDKKNMKKLHLEGNRGYNHGFASPTAPSLDGSRRREDDEYHVPDPVDTSIWYIRADGKIIKDKMGTPFQFRNKEAARKSAMTMMAKPFNAGKKFVLTTQPQDDAPVAEAAGPATHRIGLTVTDPNHPMVSKRGETYHKTVRITQDVSDREAAINQAIAHYRRKGYKVHDHHYIGTVDNEPVAEATGDKPFDKMMTKIKQGTNKQKTADRKEQQKQSQQRARDAFGNMFGGGNPADKLSIRKGVAEGELGLDHKRNRFKSLKMRENAEELNIGDPVIITGDVEFKGKTGDIDSFGDMKRFVVVDLYNHGKHSFHSSDVSYNDHADKEDDLDEDMYQYNKEDPYNSEFAPSVGMGRMTLRGWKQSLIRRTAELAQQMAAAGQNIDKSALWDQVYAKLKSMNMDPIAQEIELAHKELEKIRQRGGVRSRAFNK